MELRHLRYFVAVADELNFTRAAERLHISTPALTKQIQQLEQELGTRLFVRTKRKVSLTEAGAPFFKEARQTLQQAEHAELVAKLAGRGELGHVKIGYVSSAACTGALAAAVTTYRESHPLVVLSVVKMQSPDQLAQLSDGRLDIGYLRPPARYPVRISGLVVVRQSIVIALPGAHRLAALKSIPAAMLAQEHFIAPSNETEDGMFQHTAAVGQRGKFTARIVERIPDLFTTVALVAAGVGVAVVPQSCSCIQIPGVAYRPLSGRTRSAEMVAAFRRDERAPAVKAFIAQLRDQSAELTKSG